MTTSFAAMDVAGRIDRLRRRFDDLGCDALLVTNLVNVRYLTGFTGSAAFCLVGRDSVVFTTDGRYAIQSEQQLGDAGVDADIVIGGYAKQKEALAALAAKHHRLGLEAGNVTWGQQRAFDSDWFADNELVATEEAVETLRLVKDAGELDRISAACKIADDALTNLKPMLKESPTEKAFALALDFEMRRLGAEDISFDTIVASGPNGAKAHHEPSNRVINAGELVVIDYGALVEGYHSDTTRTLCVGEPSDPQLQRMYDVVIDSQAQGVASVREGATSAEVDSTCRAVIDAAGWGDYFTHSTGHGVGLDIHEAPAVAGSVTDSLRADQVVTVEPGVYIAGLGGVRIEDTVVVTQDGCRNLTNIVKDLVVA